jgi:hypothetical protein
MASKGIGVDSPEPPHHDPGCDEKRPQAALKALRSLMTDRGRLGGRAGERCARQHSLNDLVHDKER